jgi:hypothetical protein
MQAARERHALPSSHRFSPVLVVYALGVALVLGLGSAYRAVNGGHVFGSVQVGPWTAWPRLGSREADPYARAVMARSGEIALGVGEGLLLTTALDNNGRTLEARCAYRIGATAPQARLWTLTLYDSEGRPVATELNRSGFTSAEVLRDGDGRFAIVLSREVQPGNWLQMPEAGRVSLAMRLYDTPAAVGSAALDARAVPAVERLECAS